MPRKPKAVLLSKLDDIQASLKQKAATPKTISLEELVKSLAKPIQDMLSAGYDYSDVAEVFKEHGVELAASGIKSFHKKALATDTDISGDNSLGSSEQSISELASESTDDEATNGDGISAVDSDGSSNSLSEPSEQSSDSTNKTTKGKRAAAKTHGQFNVTDRSDL
ncbi:MULTISPECIES: hypothetical protein [Nostoc]|uniref:Uncharacterized protein n=1 Tax=Nostoc paludosum FACHB-159 TaxID=2692908 RepID=A0ABR8KIY5_9NOSO|nr:MULTISPECIES: hypothetical protein [Nostoc]MBD2681551.1 hypothetical protein [Nostoc sp. FACHB-857]MBD2738012.1 hypothetical protein [Nostoc paludosum FACHB-159]